MTRLGEKIKKLRLEQNLTLSKLAEIAEVGQSTINDIESGKAKNPKTNTLTKLANALSININELILENWDDIYNENDKLTNEVKLLESIQKTYGKQSVELLEDFSKLNVNGKTEALKRVSELTEINKYIETKIIGLITATKEENIGKAAHNDFADDEEQQKLMKEDLDEL